MIWDEVDKTLKELKKIKELIRKGIARPVEKEGAFNLAKKTVGFFTEEIFKRKAEKVSKIAIFSGKNKGGNEFVPSDEANQLDDWINLFEEFKDSRKTKTEISNDKVHINSVIDGEDQHIFITDKDSNEHTHLILDWGTGEIRIDPKDKSPHTLIKKVQARLELNNGEIVQVTGSKLTFVEPDKPCSDIKAYITTKDSYFVLEIYNNGDEDLDNFEIQINWTQEDGPKERILKEFNGEKEDLSIASPRHLTVLRQGERVYSHIPRFSIDGNIKVKISCKEVKSEEIISREFDLKIQKNR